MLMIRCHRIDECLTVINAAIGIVPLLVDIIKAAILSGLRGDDSAAVDNSSDA